MSMRLLLRRHNLATAVLAFASVGLALASFRVGKRTQWLTAPFVTDAGKLAAMARRRLPGVRVVVAGPRTMGYDLQIQERVLLSRENWPAEYPMYQLGPVLPLGRRQVLVGLQKESRILRFSLDGELLGEVGEGPGNGPGEIRSPFRAFVDVADSSVWVYSPGNGLLQHFTDDGEYLSSVRVMTPQFLIRDLAVDSRRQLVYFSYWDWDRNAPVHIYDLSGRFLRSLGRGPYTEPRQGHDKALARNMGFWENYAAGHLFLWRRGLWFARANPYELCFFDSSGDEELLVFRSAEFLRPPAYRHMGGLNFVGPYTSQVTAVAVVDRHLLVWIVSEEPKGSGSKYESVLDVLSLDGRLLASKRWNELRWVWSFGPDWSFLAARRAQGTEQIVRCRLRVRSE